MKVICIDNDIPAKNETCNDVPNPVFGDIDIVVEIRTDSDGEFYCLERFVGYMYSTYHFIPISEISETEMIRNYQTEPA